MDFESWGRERESGLGGCCSEWVLLRGNSRQLVSRNQTDCKHPTVHRVVPTAKTRNTEHALWLRMRTVKIKNSPFPSCVTQVGKYSKRKESGVDQGKGKVKSNGVLMRRSTGQRWGIKAHGEQLYPRVGSEEPHWRKKGPVFQR